MPAQARKAQQQKDDKGTYQAYEWHASTLRIWLVSYGIGAPVLFLTQDSAYDQFINSDTRHVTAALFLVGVALQVVLAFVNKTVMWAIYYGDDESPAFKTTRTYTYAKKVSTWFWMDCLVDLATISVFAWATVRVFFLLLKGS